jgi:hypothetical protein
MRSGALGALAGQGDWRQTVMKTKNKNTIILNIL